MIHLFHGEHVEASRKELAELKANYIKGEVVELDGKTLSVTDLITATETGSMFDQKRLVIVENLFARLNKKRGEKDEFLVCLNRFPKDTEIVFWEAKELPKTLINEFPKSTDVALFRPHRSVFSFVESLRPAREKELLDYFDLALSSESPEMIFAMLVRQFRYLIMVKDLGKNVKDLSPWQISRFLKQSQYFTLPHLLEMYKKLLEIDVKIKTGVSPFNLTQELQLFLINI